MSWTYEMNYEKHSFFNVRGKFCDFLWNVLKKLKHTKSIYLSYSLPENLQCPYCFILLTNQNSSVVSITSDDYEQDVVYCKPCCLHLVGKLNRIVAEATGIENELCVICNMPKRRKKNGCLCKSISSKMKKEMK